MTNVMDVTGLTKDEIHKRVGEAYLIFMDIMKEYENLTPAEKKPYQKPQDNECPEVKIEIKTED